VAGAVKVSVVVPVHNNWWLTRRCLDSLRSLRSTVAFEIVVVDDASTDETPERLGVIEGIRVLRLERNAQFGGACNAGASEARAPIVLFLNNDAWPMGGDALAPLVAAFARDEVVIAGSALFYEDGVTQGAGCVLLPNAHWFLSYRSLPATLEWVRTSRDAVVVPGAAFSVRKSWFERRGGFDTVFRNGFEDADLCMRARADGFTARYVADSRFAHYEAATIGRFTHENANEREFYRRWAPALATISRVERGEIGAIAVHRGPSDRIGDAVLHDLLDAIRSYGHPVVDSIPPWRRLDRRFRIAANIAWNCDGAALAPCVEISVREGRAWMRTRGAIRVDVPFMPCADPARTDSAAFFAQTDPYGFVDLVASYSGQRGEEARQDALRRGAPRRSAMRVIDLARVARFGLERPGRAIANAPIRLEATA
jgi:GT2 family glycosyltransferase